MYKEIRMNKVWLAIASLHFSFIMADPSSFVIKRDKKLSSSHLKERCCTDLMATLQETPTLLKELAQLQEVGMDIMTAIADNDFFTHTTKQQLQQDAQAYEQCRQQLEQAATVIRQQKDFLRKQKEKYKK